MAYREPPKNDHDAILALWHAVIGTNGEGLVERFESFCEDHEEAEELKRVRRRSLIKDLVIIAIAAGTLIFRVLEAKGVF